MSPVPPFSRAVFLGRVIPPPSRCIPITPFMGPSKEGTRILHYVKPSTNMSKGMCSGNRPNQYERNGLTGIPPRP